jgi:hypothetical protein
MNEKTNDEIENNDDFQQAETNARRRAKLLKLRNEIEISAPHLLDLIDEIIEIDRQNRGF